ncbi:mitochondrial fission ELM1 family protein [Telmatospirillum siberiense]|uniref:mitochondrial fission ELM1 family protein n=1 Tax=Telmatospirillum siberiense TaxID=382514 RepID=UPI001F53127E|nr:mitochondrial fission ELM1 family protein [Telmatospirillum siberiense]
MLADDRAGNVAQALGVAEALAEPFVVRTIAYDRRGGWHNLFKGAGLMGVAPASREALAPPWPDLVLGAGRRTAPIGRWIKHRSSCRLVQLMDPGWPGRSECDLIVVPRHDDALDRPNIFRILGSCHRVVPAVLAAEKAKWRERLACLPGPYLTVVVGGATKGKPFGADRGRQLAAGVRALHEGMGGSILVTTSRRTPPEVVDVLLADLPEPRYFFRWREGEENPYLGFLALADRVVVTGDSMTMCSEACANGGPVYIFSPPGLVSGKHARLHASLFAEGYARPLGGDPTPWTHPPLNASDDVAREIRARGLL